MPQGVHRIKKLAEDANARSAAYESGDGAGIRALKLDKGETATGRFCEEGDGVWYLYMHELPKKPGQQYGDRIQCLDQDDKGNPCPGCELEGVKRTARVVINFIRFDEPKLRRGTDGKAVKDAQGNYVFDGVEPALLIWEVGQGTGGRIAYLEEENNGGNRDHGITNHVVKIKRTHDNKNPFMIDVVERDKAPEAFERALFDKKTDPDKAIQSVFPRFLSRPVMSYGDMKRAFGGTAVPSGFASGTENGEAQPDQQTNIYQQAAGGGNLHLGAFG